MGKTIRNKPNASGKPKWCKSNSREKDKSYIKDVLHIDFKSCKINDEIEELNKRR